MDEFSSNSALIYKKIEEGTKVFLSYEHIWMDDRRMCIDTFKAKNPTIAEYDEQLSYYTNLQKEVEKIPTSKDIDSTHLNYKPVSDSILSGYNQWLYEYGKAMSDSLNQSITDTNTNLTQTAVDMKRELKERSDLEFVLKLINNIRDESVEVEREIKGIEEHKRTLKLYQLTQPENVADVESFAKKWEEITIEPKKLDLSFNATKDKFKQLTIKEVGTFTEEVEAFAKESEDDGSGDPKTPMENGLTLILKFKEKHKALCQGSYSS